MTATAAGSAALTVAGAAGALTGAALTVVVGAGALAACAEASGGKIDVVFNNAGIPLGGRIVDCTAEEVERTLDINLKGVIFGAQAAYPWLKASAPGSCLLNTASAAGIYGVPGGSIYSATKFGVRSITESLDAEWRDDGILVRDLMPGFIETPMVASAYLDSDGQVDPERREEYLRARAAATPLGITGRPRDVALAALYLASDASRFVTGQVLRPNGGMAMR